MRQMPSITTTKQRRKKHEKAICIFGGGAFCPADCNIKYTLFFTLLEVGCTTASTPLKDALGNTLTTQDLQTYGKLVGESGYYVYAYYKNNPKYAKEVKRCEEIYTALEKAKKYGGREGLDLVAINDATCEIITLAATAKLGPTNGALVGAGSRALIMMCYQYYKRNLKEDNLEVYLAAVWEGIEAAKKSLEA